MWFGFLGLWGCGRGTAQLQGHQQGVLSISWCPQDTTLLMSCGKDNRTFLWDLCECRPVYELPASTVAANTGGFGGFGAAAVGRRYEVGWSPRVRGVVATCAFDRKVQVFNMASAPLAPASSGAARAPSWMRRPAGASFGFGGKVASFASDSPKPGTPARQQVQFSNVVEDPQLEQASRDFEYAMQQKDYKALCEVAPLRSSPLFISPLFLGPRLAIPPLSASGCPRLPSLMSLICPLSARVTGQDGSCAPGRCH